MGGLFVKGETKYRAGVYRRHEKIEGESLAGAMNGVFCIPVKADFGPVNEVVTVTTKSALTETFMTGGTVDAATALFSGGASTVYVCRLGSGGEVASLALMNESGSEAATLKTLYPTELELTVTIKTKLGDEGTKEMSVYNGATLLEKISFSVDDGDTTEMEYFEEAMKDSKYLTLEVTGDGSLAEISQEQVSGGTAPTVTNDDYSNAFTAFEPYSFNVLCLDTVDDGVKALAAAFMERIHDNGSVGMCVIGESCKNSLTTRKANAKSYNAPYMIYCGSGYINMSGDEVDGYLAVAMQAGIIGSKECSQSIVHTEISDADSLIEKLTDTEYIDAIKNGLLLLSDGPDGQVWFDSGINTYTSLAENDDEGWKKIKRTAVRYEAFDRIDRQLSTLIGKINCDDDGINNVIQQAKKVLAAMAQESKILPTYEFYEDPENPHAADHAHFIVVIDDIDSLEKIYLTYQFEYEA